MEYRPMTPLLPFLLSALVAWALYRRVRRNFGRQPINVRRIQLRLGILSVIGALVLFASVRNMLLLGALIGGITCGLALGYFALRHTKVEVLPQGQFYTPHTYIGLFVTALFLGRIVFRFMTINLNTPSFAQRYQNPFDGYQKSPLTLAIFGVLIGYYVFFYIGMLRISRELALPTTGASDSLRP
jgi:hypothetical protein